MTKQAIQVNLKPLHDRVLVKRLEQEPTIKGGIILPDTAKKKQEQAVVVALGSGKRNKEGNLIPFDFEIGDTILIEKYAGQELQLDNEEFVILRAEEVIAIVK